MDRDLDVVANTLKRIPGLMNFLRQPDKSADMTMKQSDEHQEHLTEMFLPSVNELRGMVDIDVSMWKSMK